MGLFADLTAEQLTKALRQCGVLQAGRVKTVKADSTRLTVLSRIVRLAVSYDGAPPEAPPSIIFKTSHPDRVAAGWTAGRHEVAFYTQVASAPPGRLIPRCFAAHCDEDKKTWSLCLEDLGGTHRTLEDWPVPPTLGDCERIVDAHARHQALSWDAPHLEQAMQAWRWRDAASASHYLERLAAQIATFSDELGDRLPIERRRLLAKLVDAAPRLIERYRERRNLTVVQGDAHVWNCFLPKDGGDDVRFFDWDSWRVDVGAGDLAYMIAMHWYPDRRRRYERALLHRYHDRLLAEGVRGYDRDALEQDYRFGVLWLMTWPISQQTYGIPAMVWWNNLERIMLAVDDLNCIKLLDARHHG